MRFFLVAMLWLGACTGDKAMGDPCGSARECQDGQCVAGVDGDEPVCTRSCGGDSECPEGWSCSGATEGMVLVCVHGSSNPFGM